MDPARHHRGLDGVERFVNRHAHPRAGEEAGGAPGRGVTVHGDDDRDVSALPAPQCGSHRVGVTRDRVEGGDLQHRVVGVRWAQWRREQ